MNNGKVTFKADNMHQPSLLPASLEEVIAEDHLVRVVNRVVDSIDIRPLLAKYKGGGTSSYHPLLPGDPSTPKTRTDPESQLPR